jgi:hypothetical protein
MLQLRPIAERLSLLTIFLVDDGAHGCCGVGGFFGAGDVHPAEAQGAGFAREREVGSAAAGVVSDVGGGVVRFACWCVGGAIDAEAAFVGDFAPGAYTAIVSGKDGTGVGLVEVYRIAD